MSSGASRACVLLIVVGACCLAAPAVVFAGQYAWRTWIEPEVARVRADRSRASPTVMQVMLDEVAEKWRDMYNGPPLPNWGDYFKPRYQVTPRNFWCTHELAEDVLGAAAADQARVAQLVAAWQLVPPAVLPQAIAAVDLIARAATSGEYVVQSFTFNDTTDATSMFFLVAAVRKQQGAVHVGHTAVHVSAATVFAERMVPYEDCHRCVDCLWTSHCCCKTRCCRREPIAPTPAQTADMYTLLTYAVYSEARGTLQWARDHNGDVSPDCATLNGGRR